MARVAFAGMRLLTVCGLLALILLSACRQTTVTSTDPYIWLESPVTSPRVSAWLTQQMAATRNWRRQQTHYQTTREQLHAAWDHPKWQVVDIKNDQVFFYYNPGLADHYSLYQQPYADFIGDRARSGETPGASARLLIGAEVFVDGTRPGDIAISPDGGWLAYQINHISAVGATDRRWYVQSLTSSSPAPISAGVSHEGWYLPAEHLIWADSDDKLFFTVSVPTTGDGNGAWQARVYSYQPGAAQPELVHIEIAGRPIEQLHLVDDGAGPGPDDDSPGYALLAAVAAVPEAASSRSLLFGWRVLQLDKSAPGNLASARWLSFARDYRDDIDRAQYVGVVRGRHAFLARAGRGTGAIILADGQQSQTLVAETDAPLLSARVLGRTLVLEYLVHGSSTLRMVDLDGRPVQAAGVPDLPAPIRIDAMRALDEHRLLLTFSGILTPPRSELLDIRNTTRIVLSQDEPGIKPADFEARLLKVVSDKGISVPVWLAGPQSSLDDKTENLLLEVYGGFGVPMETAFSISRLTWMANGGAYAVAGPRGGGDYGKRWHDDGSGEQRYNSIADVLAVVHCLRDKWLTDGGNLAISGRSHGGLLAAEAVHRAPEKFSALVTEAAVFDLARLHALGGAQFWREEYQGSVSSPYQRLLTGDQNPAVHSPSRHPPSRHPPTLLITRAVDPVVAPAHSFKYAQAVQNLTRDQDAPATLLYIAPGQGHDADGTVNALIDDYALRWSFLNSRFRKQLPSE